MADFLSGIPARDGEWRRQDRWWIHPDGTRVPVIAGGTNIFALTQRAYRFYEDGTEAGATAIAAENTNISRNAIANTHLLIRVGLQESGAGSVSGGVSDTYDIQYSKNGGAFTTVTTASTNVRSVASPGVFFVEGDPTTQRLSVGTGAFIAGMLNTDGQISPFQHTANNFTEHAWSVQIIAADVANADVFTFRVRLNLATTGLTYSVTPQITVSKVAGRTTKNTRANPLGVEIGMGWRMDA